jgi:hypothetical protein
VGLGRQFAPALALLLGLIQPGLIQPGLCQDSLPPGATIMDTLHRAPDGSIVGATAPQAPAPPGPAQVAPPKLRSGARAPAPAARSAPQPAAPAVRVAAAAPASTPDALDAVSCRVLAWQPDMKEESCRRALKDARARLPAGKGRTGEAEHGE